MRYGYEMALTFVKSNQNTVSLKSFIEFCLYSDSGFYHKNPFGKDGSFITAPMISHIFGEIIGLYIIQDIISNYQSYNKIYLIEIGSGNGKLMCDILDIIIQFPNIYNKLSVICIDKTQTFTSNHNIKFVNEIDDILIREPAFFISNELLDAYSINQYKYINNCWMQNFVTCKNNKLILEYLEIEHSNINPILDLYCKNPKNGYIFEYSHDAINDFDKVCKIINSNYGCIIYFDYGFLDMKFQDTLQCLYQHKYVNIFDMPMESDITHLVNFEFYKYCAKARIPNISQMINISQGQFLQSMRIYDLLNKRIRHMSDLDAENMKMAVNRLIDPNQMGDLFKTLIIHHHPEQR